MIAYEDLVAALKSWRARNGLPNTPPDYGDAGPVQSYNVSQTQAAPDEIYDLSDDSGLIVAEDLQGQSGEYAEQYEGEPYQGDAYEGYGEQAGAIETGVEISAEGEAPQAGDYDDPPGTDAYGYSSDQYAADQYTGDAQQGQYDAFAGDEVETGAYEEPPAQQYDYDDPATDMHAEAPAGEYGGDDMYAEGSPAEGTLEADAEDVVDEMDDELAVDDVGIIGEEALPGAYDDVGDDDAALFAADGSMEEATVVAGEPGELEPDALPEPPDDSDR